MSLTQEMNAQTTLEPRERALPWLDDDSALPEESRAPWTGTKDRMDRRSIFVSLPVGNVRVSAAFFAALGFTVSPELSDDAACMVIDDNVHVRLLSMERFQDFINGELSHAGSAGGMLTSLSVGSQEEVDAILARAIAAGAKPWPVFGGQPGYSGSFQDPDGHLWEITCRPEGRAQNC